MSMKMQRKSLIDTLTNIPNKKQLDQDLENAKHPKLFILDIDNFKELNIKYSDSTGDAILQKFATALQSFCELHEMSCYRVQDDEFALLKNIPFDLNILENLINAISNFIALQKYQHENNDIDINAHMGISLDHFKAFEKASKALNLAKTQNQPFVTYSQFAINLLNECDEERFKNIKKAIDEKKDSSFFQPIIDINKNTLYKEALIRIEGKDGVQSPKFFLDIAHKRGIYPTIIKEISTSLSQIKELKSINLSYHDFEDEELYEYLIDTYKDTNTIFELQNDTFLHTIVNLEKIKKLKNNNIQICIDNVQNVSDLEPFEEGLIDFVKVYGDIIRLLPLHDKEYQICLEILAKIKALNAKSIATHINSESSFHSASEMGFDYFQGFLFGKPSEKF